MRAMPGRSLRILRSMRGVRIEVRDCRAGIVMRGADRMSVMRIVRMYARPRPLPMAEEEHYRRSQQRKQRDDPDVIEKEHCCDQLLNFPQTQSATACSHPDP